MKEVAVLFARTDSVYKTIPGCDVYDKERNARTWRGRGPVVAHPPCRAWGALYKFAHPEPGEKELALWAVDMVRMFGGVLEHPAYSKLWAAKGLPLPGKGADAFGGWTLPIFQHCWGHRAEKATWLYIVGVDPKKLPPMPLVLGDAVACVRPKKNGTGRPIITKSEREATPPASLCISLN